MQRLSFRDSTVRPVTGQGKEQLSSVLCLPSPLVPCVEIAEMEYSGANSILLRLLLDKKYARHPYRVLDAPGLPLPGSPTEKRELPVPGTSAFLTWSSAYKADLATEQEGEASWNCSAQPHPQLSPEIRRELVSAIPEM